MGAYQGNIGEAKSRAVAGDLSVMELIGIADSLKGVDIAGVVDLYDQFIVHNAEHPVLYAVLFNFGTLLTDLNMLEQAAQAFERAVALNPDFFPAYINLGRVYERLGNVQAAVLQWDAITGRLPQVTGSHITHMTMALNQMARVLEQSQQDEATEKVLKMSLELDPQQREPAQHVIAARQRQCAWPTIQPGERATRQHLLRGISPLSINAYTDDPAYQLALSWFYNLRDIGEPVGEIITRHWAADTDRPDGRIRIGYLSSDLREHAIGHLMYEVLGLHDRSKVEVYSYYCGIKADNDPIHQHYRADSDQFIDITGMDDVTAARRIADDGIQILIDVNGYTRDGRIKLLALRPAPVIVNWLGFPGTMGSPYHHYIVADDWIIPPESEKYYSEKVERLSCYQPNNRLRTIAAETPSRAHVGLPEDAFVYCCFNGTHKITRFTFDRWLEILQRVPNSVLWLLSGAELSHVNLKTYAESKGLDPNRIIFADKLANAHHLARYPLADLFLDTTPYGAHTTCSDALWMGVPVLTLSGRSFAARVCGSLVRSAGLPELVTESPRDYVDHAVALGHDRQRLNAYKARLKANRDTCTLFDTAKLVRDMEGLYARMWQAYREGRLHQPDLTNLDTYLEVAMTHDHDAVEVQAIEDYEGFWREKLAKRNAWRPLPHDNRLWRG
jgi:predicted O-linked N-acetylglucosamine transferase (SPINDLY family)